MAYKYFPVLRARQQEMDALIKFDFGNQMIPIVEIIKEKARANQIAEGHDGYSELFNNISAEKVFVDLPIYLDPTVSTATEVRKFFLSTISNLGERISYYMQFNGLSNKVIPVISVLQPHSDEADTLIHQFQELSQYYPQIAIRIYINRFEEAISEIKQIQLRDGDYIIYDIDTTEITNPLVKIHKKKLDEYSNNIFKIVVRSAINTEIQNVKLQHGDIIPEANNSLLELYKTYGFNAFGDFAGVKKDDITSGGTISPGFIFFSPEENLFYGFKGTTKSLSEFETRIVPDVLDMEIVQKWEIDNSPIIIDNHGYLKLQSIKSGAESGRNQAKFKWIAIMHYLHCIKTMIIQGRI